MPVYTIGFSPCPNDTFIFDALVNNQLATEHFELNVLLEDVQTLNEWALQGKLDISKVSYGVYPLIKNNYTLIESGGALGNGVGPLLISKHPISLDTLHNCTIAIPGKNTTANLLFSWAFPAAANKKFMVFHQIEDAVQNGIVDAGVIIHENRFTYTQKGLHKLVDLGELWEKQLQIPIPLGGIVVKKSIPTKDTLLIEKLIKESIAIAWKNYPSLSNYVKNNAQEMSEEVMRKHIELYVNPYTLEIGKAGKAAIDTLLQVHQTLQ